jgi:hypothetical protein
VTASRVDATLIAVPLSSDAAEIGYNIIGRAPDIIPNTELSAHRDFDAAVESGEIPGSQLCGRGLERIGKTISSKTNGKAATLDP